MDKTTSQSKAVLASFDLSSAFDYESDLAAFESLVAGSYLADELSRVMDAARFAANAHAEAGQLEAYTGRAYVAHTIKVATVLMEHERTVEEVIAGLLHDTKEDTAYKDDAQRAARFGAAASKMVDEVSNVSRKEDGNRARRKEIDRAHLAAASAGGANVKLADVIVNTRDVVEKDANFAKVYLREKESSLEVLAQGDAGLLERAGKTVAEAMGKLRALGAVR